MLDFAKIQATPLEIEPYPYMIVADVLVGADLAALPGELPEVREGGAIPVADVSGGPSFDRLVSELEGERFRKLLSDKFAIDLDGLEVATTFRGMMRWRDGVIHTDTPAKAVTVLLYLNTDGGPDQASLRILRSGDDIDDYVAEVPPRLGTMVMFKVTDNCWRGHKPMVGKRSSLQLNYLSGKEVKGHEKKRRARARLARFFGIFR